MSTASGKKRSDGCWTCRIRRKRCDEVRPVCRVCKSLHIECVYSEQKPDWMDGAQRQRERMETIKMQVRANAAHRRERQVLHSLDEPFIITSDSDYKAANEMGTAPAAPVRTVSPVNHSHPEDEDAPMVDTEPTNTWQSPATQDSGLWLRTSEQPACMTPLSTVVGESSNASQTSTRAKPEAFSLPPSDEELSSINLGREAETEFVQMYLDFVFPFLFPFYRPPMLEGGRHWLLNLLRQSKVAFHTSVSLSSYFFTIAIGDAITQTYTCRSLVWGQLIRQTSLALKRIQEDMESIAPDDNLIEATRIVGSIIQQLVVEVTIKRSVDWSLHLNPAIALFQDIFTHHGTKSGQPDLHKLLSELPAPTAALFGTTPLPRTADRTAFTFFTTVLLYIDILASTSLDRPPQLRAYHTPLLNSPAADTQIRLESVFGAQTFVFLALAATSSLSAWKKASKSAGTLSVPSLVQRASFISAALDTGLSRLDAGSARHEPHPHIVPGGFFRGYYARLENRTDDHADVERATRLWACAARVYLAVVVSGWQPATADVRADVAVGLELLRGVEEPAKIRSFAWPLCVVGCLADVGQEQDVRDVVGRMGNLKEFGTVGQVLRIVEAVWGAGMSVDRDSWDVAACLSILGSPALLI